MEQKAYFIVYDGECPFCSRYVKMLRLKQALGRVELIDARSNHAAVRQVVTAGLDLNEGMALIDGDRIYHGDACINRLALMSTPSGLLNRVNAAVFRSPTASRVLYPVLRTGRNAVLALLGRSRIDPLDAGAPDGPSETPPGQISDSGGQGHTPPHS